MFTFTGRYARSKANMKYAELDATRWLLVELLDEKNQYRTYAIVSDINFIPCLSHRKYIALA